MKESEYVLAGDIARVRAAQSILREVIIDDKDLRAAMRRLQKVLNSAVAKLPEDWEDEA